LSPTEIGTEHNNKAAQEENKRNTEKQRVGERERERERGMGF